MNKTITKGIVEKIKKAVHQVYEKDEYLIGSMYDVAREQPGKRNDEEHHVGERAIMYKIAHYLDNLLITDPAYKGYSVDCEYNRNIIDPKRLNWKRKPNKKSGKVFEEQGEYLVIPDIIVHKRNSSDANLLVAEIKTYWNQDTTDDINKLIGFTDKNGEYKYALGVSILIDREEKDVKYKFIVNGRPKYAVGYTQGVYDMFHIGHLHLINNAADMCDKLIVGVNSDRLVEEYKGKKTVICQEDRAEIVRNLKSVDECVIVETLDKVKQYEKFKFDVVFIGDDWKGNERWLQTERDLEPFGVDVVYLPHTPNISSTLLKVEIPKRAEE